MELVGAFAGIAAYGAGWYLLVSAFGKTTVAGRRRAADALFRFGIRHPESLVSALIILEVAGALIILGPTGLLVVAFPIALLVAFSVAQLLGHRWFPGMDCGCHGVLEPDASFSPARAAFYLVLAGVVFLASVPAVMPHAATVEAIVARIAGMALPLVAFGLPTGRNVLRGLN